MLVLMPLQAGYQTPLQNYFSSQVEIREVKNCISLLVVKPFEKSKACTF
jgi:hypothetical protein